MWQIADCQLKSRFFLGTAGYPSLQTLQSAIRSAGSEVITVSLTRSKGALEDNQFFNFLADLRCRLLPNTAGCYTAAEAVATANLAREVFKTNWVKLEVIGDDETLQANSLELIKAAVALNKAGFVVFPYCTDDVVICQELVKAGCKILMPMAGPIGSGQGLLNKFNLKLLRNRFSTVKLIIDAGIGRPSDAAIAMEMGYDGILLNSAVSNAVDPVKMAMAFNRAIDAGRMAYEAGIMPSRDFAVASTPYLTRPFSKERV